jgi:hypothetical protein
MVQVEATHVGTSNNPVCVALCTNNEHSLGNGADPPRIQGEMSIIPVDIFSIQWRGSGNLTLACVSYGLVDLSSYLPSKIGCSGAKLSNMLNLLTKLSGVSYKW